jgi:hypothetical protein
MIQNRFIKKEDMTIQEEFVKCIKASFLITLTPEQVEACQRMFFAGAVIGFEAGLDRDEEKYKEIIAFCERCKMIEKRRHA